jgi:predicted transcriptional regulator
MRPGRALRRARRRAQLTQRALALRTGISQPTIAKIEAGTASPRVDTLERLLDACGETTEAVPHPDPGADRTQVGALVAMTPRQRAATLGQRGPWRGGAGGR